MDTVIVTMVSLTADMLQSITQRLVEEFRPERVYLFGSRAYGVPRADSDLDIAVVLRRGEEPRHEDHVRARQVIGSIGCDVDVLVYAADRFDQRSGWRSNMEHTVRNEGRLLFGVDGMNFCREWLNKGLHDYMAAERLMQGTTPLLGLAAFHFQQAAEKALKAYLVERNEPFEKTHDLRILCDTCSRIDAAFKGISLRAGTLTPYAVQFRYPGDPEATPEQVAEAYDTARAIWSFVLDRLPQPLRDEFRPHPGE